MAYETLFSLDLATQMVVTLEEKCLVGIVGNRETCAEKVEQSLAMVTPLALEIGYEKASHLAYRAYGEKKTIRELALEEEVLPVEKLEEILDPRSMI